MKKIHIFAGFNRNFGDLVLLDQQCKLLRSSFAKISDEQIVFIPISSHTSADGKVSEITESMVDYINSGNMLIVGCGGQLMPDKNRHGFWQFNIHPNLISKIRVPLVLFGIGSNTFAYADENGNGGPLTTSQEGVFHNHLRKVCEKASLVSVRDSYAWHLFCELGIDYTHVIGDSAFTVERPRDGLGWIRGFKGFTLGIVFGGDRVAERYGSQAKYLQALEALAHNVNNNDMIQAVCIIPHSNLWDQEPAYLLQQMIDQRKKTVWYPHYLLPESVDKIPELLGMYTNCDCVISTRWHGVVIPAALGIPAIPLGGMIKQKALGEDLTNGNLLMNDCNDFDWELNRSLDINTRTAVQRNVKSKINSLKEFADHTVRFLCN